MKILVTGGAGFIGSHVVDVLIEAGHHVSIVDNLWEHGGGRMENINPKADFYKVDIRQAALSEVFRNERPEVICHLAAQPGVKFSTEDPAHDADVNILGLINLLQNATRFGVRKIVFSSSGATYGTVEKMPVDENTTQHPESPYGTILSHPTARPKRPANHIFGSGRICTGWILQSCDMAMFTVLGKIPWERRESLPFFPKKFLTKSQSALIGMENSKKIMCMSGMWHEQTC